MTEQPLGAWSYRPGSWFGVFGSATTLLLPASEKARVADLWSRIDDGADFDDVLDALLQSGLGVLPGFVLVSGGEGPTKILVRGPSVRATIVAQGQEIELDGSTVTTWVERTLPEVTSLRVRVDADSDVEPGAEDLTILGGLVRVGGVDHPPFVAVAESAAPAFVLVPPDLEPEPAPAVEDDDVIAELATRASTDSMPDPLTDPFEDPGTQMMDVAVPTDEVAEVAEESSPLNDDGGDDDDETTGTSVPPAPLAPSIWPSDAPPPPVPDGAPTTPPLPAPLPAGSPSAEVLGTDHDGSTRSVIQSDDLAPSPPGIPGQPMAPSVGRSVATLVISNGERVEVDRVVLIGRAPEARRHTSTEAPRLVTVPSPLHEISATHIEIRPGSGADHGAAVVTDMGSTNGTLLFQPGLAPEDLKPGIAVQLLVGATINLGDGITIQVVHP